jgi:hypothetical protein
LRSSTSGWPISQNDWFEARFFFRSSVSRSVFICALSSVTPGQFTSSMSFAASGSKVKAQNRMNFGDGRRVSASVSASSTCLCSSAACSGPKLTTTRSPVSASDPLAWMCFSPGSVSNSAKRSMAPPLPRTPVLSSSSRHSDWREVSPERATVSSAS